jgi:hypothetical protein
MKGFFLENTKENPHFDDSSLAAESRVGADDAAVLPVRLNRYSKAHHRALDMSDYAMNLAKSTTSSIFAADILKTSEKLRSCGNYLLFRDYYRVSKVRLHAASFCNKHLLCPLCAIRRGAKLVQAYMQKLAVIKAEKPQLKAYLVTLTVKDGEDLGERFNHLQTSLKHFHRVRSRQKQGQFNESCKADGAVWSYEFKRGKNSEKWHPHVHAVWLCEDAPDAKQLSKEWLSITGDSFIVDVTPFYDQDDVITGFLEVFKYAVKFSDLPLVDNWEGFKTLSGQRLIASFGSFRGVEIPDNLLDEPLDDEPYIEMLYKFVYGVGYSYVQKTDLPHSSLKRKKGRAPAQALQPYKKGKAHLNYLRKKYDS